MQAEFKGVEGRRSQYHVSVTAVLLVALGSDRLAGFNHIFLANSLTSRPETLVNREEGVYCPRPSLTTGVGGLGGALVFL
jgi:hypothetical protein